MEVPVSGSYLRWHHQHGRKIRYPTRMAAERARWRLLVVSLGERRRLNSYRCHWGPNWQHGPRAAPGHWHLGHRRRRQRTWLKAYVVWPFYRARRAIRTRYRQSIQEVRQP
jgi:hypothetical protein